MSELVVDLPPGVQMAFVVAFGLICGSFANVVVARLPEKKSLAKPRSRCPGCEAPIAWYDNIPVLSYLVLGGRCRRCKKPISVRYPVIELLTALLFVASYSRFGPSLALFVRDWPVIVGLVALTFIDLERHLIPDPISLGGLALCLATAWAVPGLGTVSALIGAGVGFGFFYLLAWAYQAKTGRSGLGGGDIKLLAMLGAFIGVEGVFATILISSVLGSVLGLVWAARVKKSGGLMTVAIPYGPFLVIGALYYYLLGDVLWLRFSTPI